MEPRFQCFGRGDGIGWRLLSGNHRSLAVSAHLFPGVDAARADAAAVALLAPLAVIDLVVQSTTWRWVMIDDDGRHRAVASVAYARRMECRRAVARFREAAPVAEFDARAAPGVPSARRMLPPG